MHFFDALSRGSFKAAHIVALTDTRGQHGPAVVKNILSIGVALKVQRNAGMQLLRPCVPDQDMLRQPALLFDLRSATPSSHSEQILLKL